MTKSAKIWLLGFPLRPFPAPAELVSDGQVSGALMARVEWFLACALMGRLGTLDIEIHDHRILPAPDYHGFTRHI